MAKPESASASRIAGAIPEAEHFHRFEHRRAGLMLTVQRILELFASLNEELARRGGRGEVYLAGGAVMCLVFQARPATKDIDALLIPSAELRSAAQAVARKEGLPDGWLNDAVKGYFSANGRFDVFEELSHLRVYVPHPEYLLAMKCLALRLGEEFQDLDDVKVLLRALGLRTVAQAEAISGKGAVCAGRTNWRARGSTGRAGVAENDGCLTVLG